MSSFMAATHTPPSVPDIAVGAASRAQLKPCSMRLCRYPASRDSLLLSCTSLHHMANQEAAKGGASDGEQLIGYS